MTRFQARPIHAPHLTSVAGLACLLVSVIAPAGGLAGSAASDAGAQGGASRTISVREGVYSAAQAERGAKLYKTRCETCHAASQFSGFVFMQSWSGQTAHALFNLIRTSMPPENPGSLRRQEYADRLAYLFKINNLPAGRTELKGTDEALRQVLIEAPERQVGSRPNPVGAGFSRPNPGVAISRPSPAAAGPGTTTP
jgi:S-disulfanyl-L-cysteine oxidoreductase SoxD